MIRWITPFVFCLGFLFAGSCTDDETVPFTLSVQKGTSCSTVDRFQFIVQEDGLKLWEKSSTLSGASYENEISSPGSGDLNALFYLAFSDNSPTVAYSFTVDPSGAEELKLTIDCAEMPPILSAYLDDSPLDVTQPSVNDDDDDSTDDDDDILDGDIDGDACQAGAAYCAGGVKPIAVCIAGVEFQTFPCISACDLMPEILEANSLDPSCCDCDAVLNPDGDTDDDDDSTDGDAEGDDDDDVTDDDDDSCGAGTSPPSSLFFQAEDRLDGLGSSGTISPTTSESSSVSGQYLLLRSSCPSDELEEIVIDFTIDREYLYNFNVDYVQCGNWGNVEVFVDDATEALVLMNPPFPDTPTLLSLHSASCPSEAEAYAKKNILYESLCLGQGNHKLRFRVNGHEAMSTGCNIGVDYIKIQADY